MQLPPLNFNAGGGGPVSGRQDSRASGGYDGSGWGVSFAPVGDMAGAGPGMTPSAAIYRADAYGMPEMTASRRPPMDQAVMGVPAWFVVGIVAALLIVRRG